jgi:hypothetical protein
MPYEDIQVESYKFMNFEQQDKTVYFCVVPIEGRDVVTNDDIEPLNKFLDDNLGKWENLVKAGLNLVSELGIVPVDETTLGKYQKEFGSENYRINVQRDDFGRSLHVHVCFSAKERHRREASALSLRLKVQEIYGQLKNIPKWKAFEKAIELIRKES